MPPIPLVQLAICDSPSPVMFRFSPGGFIISPLSHLPRSIVSLYDPPHPQPKLHLHYHFRNRRRLLPPRPNQQNKKTQNSAKKETQTSQIRTHTPTQRATSTAFNSTGIWARRWSYTFYTRNAFFHAGTRPVHGWSHGDMGHGSDPGEWYIGPG